MPRLVKAIMQNVLFTTRWTCAATFSDLLTCTPSCPCASMVPRFGIFILFPTRIWPEVHYLTLACIIFHLLPFRPWSMSCCILRFAFYINGTKTENAGNAEQVRQHQWTMKQKSKLHVNNLLKQMKADWLDFVNLYRYLHRSCLTSWVVSSIFCSDFRLPESAVFYFVLYY